MPSKKLANNPDEQKKLEEKRFENRQKETGWPEDDGKNQKLECYY